MVEPDRGRSYLVECYWPGINEERLAAAVTRLETATAGRHVAGATFRGSILVPSDETVFCRFDGDEASVRATCQRAGIPIERVVESRWVEPAQASVRVGRDL